MLSRTAARLPERREVALLVEKQSSLDRVDEASVFGIFYAIDFDDVMLNSRHIIHGTVPRPNEWKSLLQFGQILVGIWNDLVKRYRCTPVVWFRLTSVSR